MEGTPNPGLHETLQARTITFSHLDQESVRENRELLLSITAVIAQKAFGFSTPIPPAAMSRQLENIQSLTLAEDSGRVIGYQSQKRIQLAGKQILYYSVAVLPEFQHRRVGRQLMAHMIRQEQPDIICGRTQNPAAVLSLRRAVEQSGHEVDILPIDISYTEHSEAQVLLLGVVEALGYGGKIDAATGLQRNAYSEGKLGNYRVDVTHEEVSRIENVFSAMDLRRENGDAVFYMTILQEKQT